MSKVHDSSMLQTLRAYPTSSIFTNGLRRKQIALLQECPNDTSKLILFEHGWCRKALEVLAKSNGETLTQHVVDCLRVADTIIPSLPLSEEEKRILSSDIRLALAFHDAGKAAIGFQKVMEGKEQSWGGKRHEILSASLASSVPSISESVIFAILTHHKSIPSTALGEEKRALDFQSLPLDEESEQYLAWKKMKSEWKANYPAFRRSWVNICGLIGREDLIGIDSLPRIRLDCAWLMRQSGPVSQLSKKSYSERRYFSLLRGLLMVSDHLASGSYFPPREHFSIQMHVNSGIYEKFRAKLHAFQLEMSQTKGSVILRAPTGSGKTEAALMWAASNEERYSRLYYVLPNIASINAMFQRLKALFGAQFVGLLHSRAREAIYRRLSSGDDLESKLKDQGNAGMLSAVARSIWFPVRVCTPHQILRFSLRGKGWETMLAEFPRALFVFDEVHAYDPRLVGQIIATAMLARRWMAESAFVSATMPSFLANLIKRNFTEEGSAEPKFLLPDAVQDRQVVERKRHILHLEEGHLSDYVSRIIDDMERGLRVLIVCNTVSASQQIFMSLRETLKKKYAEDTIDNDLLMLIHSRFTRRDRSSKEYRIMDPARRPKILVSTQVVEVSLDISYDVAYLEPAPIDALIQRMGRVNRYGEKGLAPIHLVKNEISPRSVYREKERINRSIQELSELSRKGVPVSESDLVEAAERVYSGGYNEEETDLFNQGINNLELQDFENEMLAGASEDWKDQILSDSWGIDILPKRYLKDFQTNIERRLFIEAYSYLAPVPWKSRIREEADFSGDLAISSWNYSDLSGFSVPADDPWDDDLHDQVPSDPSNII